MSSFSRSYSKSSHAAEQAKRLVDQAKEMLDDAVRQREDLKHLPPEDEAKRAVLEQQIRVQVERSRELAKIAKELARS